MTTEQVLQLAIRATILGKSANPSFKKSNSSACISITLSIAFQTTNQKTFLQGSIMLNHKINNTRQYNTIPDYAKTRKKT
jgi:hypothetical protein